MKIEELHRIFLENPVASTDTRNMPAGAMFFCLKGEHFDGNTFAQQAADAGADCIIIDDASYIDVPRAVLVEDALSTLQALARFHRQTLNIPVIGITGTNGKTTTKELITAVLSHKFRVSATRGNLNNHIGVPLTLLSITPETEIAVIEMGASFPGEIAMLCDLAKPGFGLITNIGKAHLEGFKSLESIIETKTALYKSVDSVQGVLFIHADDALLMANAGKTERRLYGTGPECGCRGLLTASNPFAELKWGGKLQNETGTRLVGGYNFPNILASICIGKFFGVTDAVINEALTGYRPSDMRSQYCETEDNRIIMDAYNANPASMANAISSFAALTTAPKVLIIGDMLELGENEKEEHAEIIEMIRKAGLKDVYLVGPLFSSVAAETEFACFPDSAAAREFFKNNKLHDATILIKGSRGMKMEKIMEAL